MTAWLRRQGYQVNHKRVERLMNHMGLQAAQPKVNTSRKHPEKKIYPYLLSGVKIACPDHVWSDDKRWLTLCLAVGQDASVSWQPSEWTIQETMGPKNELGVIPDLGMEDRLACTSHYRGNELIRMEPAGASLPYVEGL